MKIKITGIKAVVKALDPKKVNRIIAIALTKTIKTAQLKLSQEVKKRFDRPTGTSVKGFYIVPATKNKLYAVVGIKGPYGDKPGGAPVIKWLTPHIKGGDRKVKAGEVALRKEGWLKSNEYYTPGKKARLNKFGNLTKGFMNKLLSSMDAMPSRPTDSKGKRIPIKKKGTDVKKYFGVRTGSHPTLPGGVYRRKARGKTNLVLKFVEKKPSYKARFPFAEIARKVYKQVFKKTFQLWMRK